MTPTHTTARCLLLTACAALLGACGATEDDDGPSTQEEAWTWDVPEGVPAPRVPEDNPMSAAKVELGRHLFYDTRLSGNQTQSCASCHRQELAFTDGRTTAIGSTDEEHFRHSMGLTNIAYNSTFGWVSPAVTSLEKFTPIPMFNEDPVELGLAELSEEELTGRLKEVPRYQELFARAYPEAAAPITLDHTIKALTSFQRSLLSYDSPFDRYTYEADDDAMSESAKRGMDLFFSERLECFHCHGGTNFTDSVDHEGLAFTEVAFHNTGLYNVDFEGAYPEKDRGLYDLTGEEDDMGKFKAPTLRNIAVTAPYFHDGSAATLDEVIDHYERGGRAITSGPYIGDGSQNPHKSDLIQGFTLTDQERADLIAFLEALTDETFLTNPAYSDPWE